MTAALNGSAALCAPLPPPVAGYSASNGSGPQRRSGIKETFKPCRGCGKLVRATNRTHLCRPCWLDPAKRPQTAARRNRQQPREAIAGALRVLEAAARRAEDEDAAEGLARLLDVQARLRVAVNRTGRVLVARDGASAVAAELGWSPQRAWERWGGKRPGN